MVASYIIFPYQAHQNDPAPFAELMAPLTLVRAGYFGESNIVLSRQISLNIHGRSFYFNQPMHNYIS
jgi:hypothetical protein